MLHLRSLSIAVSLWLGTLAAEGEFLLPICCSLSDICTTSRVSLCAAFQQEIHHKREPLAGAHHPFGQMSSPSQLLAQDDSLDRVHIRHLQDCCVHLPSFPGDPQDVLQTALMELFKGLDVVVVVRDPGLTCYRRVLRTQVTSYVWVRILGCGAFWESEYREDFGSDVTNCTYYLKSSMDISIHGWKEIV